VRFTIYGLWRNPHGSGYLEVKDVRENRDLVSRERTGVFYPTRALGVQVTHEKNVEEALRIAATIKANRLTPEDS
jgi:hypothetical protein